MTMIEEALLKDTLHAMSTSVVRNVDDARYGRGVFVGVVGAMMSVNDGNFLMAITTVKRYMPEDYMVDCVPESWREEVAQ